MLGSDGAFGPSGTHTPVVFLAIFSRICLSLVSFSLISLKAC